MNKIVALATKPKRAAPKAKYIDPIIKSTFNQDGSMQEIVRTLSVRLRDPNTTVAFKSLIVLHQMLRSGSLEPTFSYLASSSLTSQLSSHEAPNISAYGHYLAARIKAYSNLKRDIIRDKSDRRNMNRLRTLGVEGGLLRETREVQRMIATLVESKFYSDDIDDEVSMTALRFLVKDLLVLFTAVNEGVINVLEHYFEMSHTDATLALKIYKTFCRDTEKVVAYLGIAKKMQHVTNIPIPNLKHAPVSLVSSLEEYLNDPNFERNREEYKENKRIADGKPKGSTQTASKSTPSSTTPVTSSAGAPSTSNANAPSEQASSSAKAPTSFTDFFESIEQSQTAMFDPQTGSPTLSYFQQQANFNPFLQQQQMPGMPNQFGMVQPQMTGFVPNPFMQPQMTGFVQPQMTGFVQPQMTGMAPNPFRQSMMPTGASPFGAFAGGQPQQQMQPQMTGSPFLGQNAFGQPQQQHSNGPFGNGNRPVSMMPQGTGAFGGGRPTSPFASSQPGPSQGSSAFTTPGRVASPFGNNVSVAPNGNSTPAPLTVQKTGARNPFAPAPGTILNQPKQPVGPSMNELAYNAFNNQQQQQHQDHQQQQQQQSQRQQSQPQQTAFGVSNGFNPSSSFQAQPQQHSPSSNAFASTFGDNPAPLTQMKTGMMGNVASEFAFSSSNNNPSNASSSTITPSSSAFTSPSTFTTPTSSAFTPSMNFQSSGMTSPSSLTSQPTGFGGSTMKAFQPSSDFGNKLASELGGGQASQGPGMSYSSTGFQQSNTTPSQSNSAFGTGSNGTNAFGSNAGQSNNAFASQPTGSNAFSSQQTGSSGAFSPQPSSNAFSSQQPSSPIQPQSTGFNPFRGSTLPPLNAPLSSQRTGFVPSSAFGNSLVTANAGNRQQESGSLI